MKSNKTFESEEEEDPMIFIANQSAETISNVNAFTNNGKR